MIVLHDQGKVYQNWGVNRFPDGQQQFWINSDHPQLDLDICIKSPEILDLFFQMIDTMTMRSVRITYLYGARSDKNKAGERDVCNLPSMIYRFISCTKTIISPMVTDWQVVVPHSAQFPGNSFDPLNDEWVDLKEYDAIVFPDESSMKRFHAKDFEGIDYVICEKERDQESGRIIKHVIPEAAKSYKRILVMDDLCDGGRTFLDIREALEENVPEKLDLLVVHGVFSNGALDKLSPQFNTIYTTNSYHNWESRPGLVVHNVWRAGEWSASSA